MRLILGPTEHYADKRYKVRLTVALLSTIVVSIAAIPRVRRNLVMLGGGSGAPPSKYSTVLLELKLPVAGAQKVPQTLLNDDLLTKVIKDVGSLLYVYIIGVKMGWKITLPTFTSACGMK